MPDPLIDMLDADAVPLGVSRNVVIEKILQSATAYPPAETAAHLQLGNLPNVRFPVRVSPEIDTWLRDAAAAVKSRPAHIITGLCAAHYGYNLTTGGTAMPSG